MRGERIARHLKTQVRRCVFKEQAHEMLEERVTWIKVEGGEGQRKEMSFLP